MKKERGVVLLTLSILLLTMVPSRLSVCNEEVTVSNLDSEPLEPHQANALWLEPSTINLTGADVGDKFNITAWVNIANHSYSWQTKVLFNPTYFNATRANYTGGKKSEFFSNHTPISPGPKIKNDEGSVLIGETLVGLTEREPGNGSLMWVELQLQALLSENLCINFSTPYGISTFVERVIDFDPILIPMDDIDGTKVHSLERAYLLLTTQPRQATYTNGKPVAFKVNVFNQYNLSLESTLTLTITGPSSYYLFDFQKITVPADMVYEYSFNWTVPEAAGRYVVEVGLVPAMLTAYDAVWLEVD